MAPLTQPSKRSTLGPRARLGPRVAFYLQASIIVSFLAASSAPTPLYATYQAKWDFSPIRVTVIFGVYAFVFLTALLTVGSLSDHVGRRPVVLVAIVLQAVAMVIFAQAGSVTALLGARVLQGLSAGGAVGALGAGMLDLDKAKGTLANAASPPIGTATGALGAGLLVAYLPDPTRVVYLALLAIFVLQPVAVTLIAETSPGVPGVLASLRPRLALPPRTRRPMLIAIPALVAGWALAGFYGSLGPALIAHLTGSDSPALGGLALFILTASAALAVPLLRSTPPRTVMLIGTAALLTGVAITLLATTISSEALFLAGTSIAGIGFGGGFQGAIRTVAPLAAPHERAGVVSIIYLASYLALGLPAILAGALVAHGSSILFTSREYSAMIMLLSAFAMLGLIVQRYGPRRRRPPISDRGNPGAAACVPHHSHSCADPRINAPQCPSSAASHAAHDSRAPARDARSDTTTNTSQLPGKATPWPTNRSSNPDRTTQSRSRRTQRGSSFRSRGESSPTRRTR
jgi:MFS family permease